MSCQLPETDQEKSWLFEESLFGAWTDQEDVSSFVLLLFRGEQGLTLCHLQDCTKNLQHWKAVSQFKASLGSTEKPCGKADKQSKKLRAGVKLGWEVLA